MGHTSISDIIIGKEGNSSKLLCLNSLGWISRRFDSSAQEHILLVILPTKVKEALSDANDFLKCAITIDVVGIAEGRIRLR